MSGMTRPSGRHRQLGPLQRMLAWLGSAVLVVAALAAGQFLDQSKPDTGVIHGPFLVAGEAGQDVAVRTFDVRLISARYSSIIKVGGGQHTTQGVWVIVKVRLVARTEPESVTYAALHSAAGKTYLATDRLNQPLIDGSRTLQPGIALEGEVAFEVPRDAIAGMTVRFAEARYDRRMAAIADIALPGTDKVTVEKDPATLAPVTLVSAQVKP